MEPQFLTVDEVAELLRIRRDTVYRLAAKGEIPGRKIGRVWRFPREFIDQFLTGAAGAATQAAEPVLDKV